MGCMLLAWKSDWLAYTRQLERINLDLQNENDALREENVSLEHELDRRPPAKRARKLK